MNAYGLFLEDLVERLAGPEGCPKVQQVRPLLQNLVLRCVAAPADRPSFREVVDVLHSFEPVAAAAS